MAARKHPYSDGARSTYAEAFPFGTDHDRLCPDACETTRRAARHVALQHTYDHEHPNVASLPNCFVNRAPCTDDHRCDRADMVLALGHATAHGRMAQCVCASPCDVACACT